MIMSSVYALAVGPGVGSGVKINCKQDLTSVCYTSYVGGLPLDHSGVYLGIGNLPSPIGTCSSNETNFSSIFIYDGSVSGDGTGYVGVYGCTDTPTNSANFNTDSTTVIEHNYTTWLNLAY